ncbi:hypothetical protein HA520_05930 [Azotobacter chroococcum]|uniref:Uncharacterized protein n=1 Tax=Azotobacter chroococcum TaxID=353 RepID=A0AA43Z4X8_9GAMM|nr:hypothetical protein [Azotobacter chroococcum]NHN76826.1 hypothetical protein [Azotobacter chroococcum]
MSWLLKRKPWLTLADAAAYLTGSTGEYVTEADLLLLAVEGQLKIAARFTDWTAAIAGTVIEPYSDFFREIIEEDAQPLPHGIEGVFDLRLTTPSMVRLNLKGEIESRAFGLEFNTAIPDRVVRITTLTLPAAAHWVVKSTVLLEFEAEIGSVTRQQCKIFSETSLETSESRSEAQPKSRGYCQEQEILAVLRQLGYDPKALPLRPAGHSGAKADARDLLLARKDLFTDSSFDKAWGRLRASGEIIGGK